ncbi:MAG: hypothetical protein IJG38_10815 [Thermoguttaceae bacterium]|nr:hypothetical protein [Thermoguttaceae bacterium]
MKTICQLTYTFVVLTFCSALYAQTLDWVEFGNPESEQLHGFRDPDAQTQTVAGQFGHSPRQIKAPASEAWNGNSMFFTLKVDPDKTNYFTVQFWGEDLNSNQLYVYIDGKLLGYRHISEYDILHHGTNEIVAPGQFYYISTVLPENVTKGKTELEFEIRLVGKIWPYAPTFDRFQANIKGDSLPIYAAFTHLGAKFEPKTVEFKPVPDVVRPAPGAEVVDKIKERISAELEQRMNGRKTLTQQDVEFLARGYRIKWSPVYDNPKCIDRVVDGIDAFYRAWRENPKLIENDPRQYNGDWFGVAPLCEAIYTMDSPEFQKRLDEPLADSSDENAVTRRQAWGEMIQAALVHLSRHRRWYTNQSMIIDWNLHRMNRALILVDKSRAFPERQTLRYLYESMGIEPWRGAETESGPALPRGESYYQITRQGLTRELGYVGMYGEVLDWGCWIYLSTCKRDADGQLVVRPDGLLDGDEKIRQQLVKMTNARQWFRYPSIDNDGYRAVRLERSIGWRDNDLTGPVMYCARTGKEGVALMIPFCTRDKNALQSTAQALADNQIFDELDKLNRTWGLRVSYALMDVPDYWEYICNNAKNYTTPHSSLLTPNSHATKSSLFTDEQNGVLALQNGDERLYMSLYWRARLGVNRLGKAHYIGKNWQQYVVLREDVKFDPSGETVVRRNWTTGDHHNGYGHIHYPGKTDSIHVGEVLAVARIPDWDKEFRLGEENGNAGRAEFYKVRFRQYLIAVNASEKKSFELDLNSEQGESFIWLDSGKPASGKITVAPNSTVVLIVRQ